MGIVGYSGRVSKSVAPNSPSETVKANVAALSVARERIGKSTVCQTRSGDAPSMDADSRKRFGMDAMAGCNVRITKGSAMSVCASGTKIGEASARPNVMMNPSPSMTADAPSGSMISGSRNFSRRVGLASAYAAG